VAAISRSRRAKTAHSPILLPPTKAEQQETMTTIPPPVIAPIPPPVIAPIPPPVIDSNEAQVPKEQIAF
jgi:hypothetical protein